MGGAGNEEKAVVESEEWYLAAYAPGVPTSNHLKLCTVPLSLCIDSIPDRHLVVQNLLISVDPYLPDGIDVYFDNVGGKMLEVVLNHVNKHARIPVCGMISQYKEMWTEREGVRNLLNIVGKEVRMEGIMVLSYFNRFGDFAKEMQSYIKEGKISSKLKIYNGIESYLESLGSLFTSSNAGKVVIEVNSHV
ncbi:hypothetical protein FH972_025624 [Carpinus fangiana]|uniref:Alcohol dehydrogenase-like C-terminal domain-containing protein n=1 Tax=Carpinus fangiana TaxID=176857 RepID=A0A5N6L261_9ROSI|nr:hypothetical protein FH972_025624 [Carpinus fangiana]